MYRVFHNMCYILKLEYLCKLLYFLHKPYIILNIKSYISEIVENIMGNHDVIIVNCELNAGVRIEITFQNGFKTEIV